MSRNTVERALHQLCVDRSAKQRFKEDPVRFLERFAMSDTERAMVLDFDVKDGETVFSAALKGKFDGLAWGELAHGDDDRGRDRRLAALYRCAAVDGISGCRSE